MQRTPLPKIIVLFVLFAYLSMAAAFGQTTPAVEQVVIKCWSYPLGESRASALASDGTHVFTGATGAKIGALSLEGRKVWTTELGGDIASNILPLESGVFVVTAASASDPGKNGESVMRSLSRETGITNWSLKLPNSDKHFLSGFNGSVIIVSKKGVIQSVDANSGSVKWKREIAEGFVSSPVFNGGRVLVAASGKQVFGVSMATGDIDSMRKPAFAITALNEIAGGGLIAGDDRGNLTSVANGGEKVNWKFKAGGEISAIYAVSENLLVTSHDNFAYFIASRNGDVVWKKRLGGRVSYIATILNKFAVITSFEEHGAVLIDLSSGRVAGQIVLGGDEYLVSDPVSSNGLIYVLTNQAAYAFSLNGCGGKSEPPAEARPRER